MKNNYQIVKKYTLTNGCFDLKRINASLLLKVLYYVAVYLNIRYKLVDKIGGWNEWDKKSEG
jgi:hypothetical protein